MRSIYYELVYPFIASFLMGLIVWYLGTDSRFSPLVNPVILVPTGVVTFVVLVLILELVTDWSVTDNVERIHRSLAA